MDEEKLRIRVRNGKDDPPPKRSRLLRYGPLVVWAVLIFIGSGNVLSAAHTSFVIRFARYFFPTASPEILAVLHLLVRKAGHLTEYAVLAGLAARAFRTSSREFVRAGWFWLALLVVIAYSLSDEFHQSFVPTRGASIYDSMIDTVGGLTGLLLVWLWQRRKIKRDASRSGVTKATVAA